MLCAGAISEIENTKDTNCTNYNFSIRIFRVIRVLIQQPFIFIYVYIIFGYRTDICHRVSRIELSWRWLS